MKKLIALSLLLCSAIFAKGPEPDDISQPKPQPEEQMGPWLTGPLLAPSGHTVPAGHVNYEPYVYWAINKGVYNPDWHSVRNKHDFTNVLIQPTFQIGVAPAVEFDIAPQYAWSHTDNQAEWEVNDLPITLAFQILQDKPGKWWPAIKLRFAANLPIGQYQRLSPYKLGTDAGGNGNWSPAAGFVLSHLYHFTGTHFLAVRYWISYSFSTPVHVTGVSVYGGTDRSATSKRGTHGTVYPGNTFQTDLGLEYTLSQNWALALDVYYAHNNKTRFSGHRDGATMKAPSRETISLAPAFEYNWSTNVGIIFGPWFTVAGRNNTDFIQWVFAVNVYD